jgi:hypothetical protein
MVMRKWAWCVISCVAGVVVLGVPACGREITTYGAEGRATAVPEGPVATAVACLDADGIRRCPDPPPPTTVPPETRPPLPASPPTALPWGQTIEGGMIAVQGLSPAEALLTLAPEPVIGPTDLPAATAWADRTPPSPPRYAAVAEAGEHRGWTLIFDPGYGTEDDGRLAALSRNGRAVLIHNLTDGGGPTFGLAEGGRIVRSFDHEHHGDPEPSTTGAPLATETGLELRDIFFAWESLRTLFSRLVGWDAFDGQVAIARDGWTAVGYWM